jgi:anti-sigma regulatory factor (Ser/Thr protein kinase)
MGLVELQLPRDAAYVGLARSIVTAGARLEGMPEERLEDLKIAVSEAAAHAVSAGAVDGGPLLLAFGTHDGAFEVHILSGLAATGEGLGEWPVVGGMGLRLIEGLADEVRFPEASRSQLVLRFTTPAATAGVTAAAALRPAG